MMLLVWSILIFNTIISGPLCSSSSSFILLLIPVLHHRHHIYKHDDCHMSNRCGSNSSLFPNTIVIIIITTGTPRMMLLVWLSSIQQSTFFHPCLYKYNKYISCGYNIFLTDWEPLCTALRLDNVRHRSEETM